MDKQIFVWLKAVVVVVVINADVQCFCACTILESKLETTNLETIYSGTVGIRLKENFY